MMHAQHLSGVGHFVRSLEIARAIAAKHEVTLTDGGRVIPRPWPENVERLALPRIHRGQRGLVQLDGEGDVTELMAERGRLLANAVEARRPDVLVIEHYPFSKWELGDEINRLIAAARSTNSFLKVVCSVRDIPRQTSHEACSAKEYADAVLSRLHARFDAVLVHGDKLLTSLAEHFPGAQALRLPVHYTGWVSEKPAQSDQADAEIRLITAGQPYVLASAGGGSDAAGLLMQCIEAWRILKARNELGNFRLVICSGLVGSREDLQHKAAAEDSIRLLPFSSHFLAWMQHAELSISCAGYNTCANLLETRCRALLVPNPNMSDQGIRAKLMERLGLARVLASDGLAPNSLAEAILQMAKEPRPQQQPALCGATRTAEIIENLTRPCPARVKIDAHTDRG